MKHYNIPVFLPELACPYRCVYCNQYSITGKSKIIEPQEVKILIKKYLETFSEKERFVEVAFFGGNFTGLPVSMQNDYLDIVQPFIESGEIDGIRCSTRPDYITRERVAELRRRGMLNIELGAQSTDNEILLKCRRGHSFDDIVKASESILSENITLGLQMMTGLPFSDEAKDMKTAEDIVRLGAKETRIYPCITVGGTELEEMYLRGEYKPQSLDEAVSHAAALYEFFIGNGVKVLRIGLHQSEELNGGGVVAGPYHKNFAEMVMSRHYRKIIENELITIKPDKKDSVVVSMPKSCMTNVIGYQAENKKWLQEKFHDVTFVEDNTLNISVINKVPPQNITAVVDERMPKKAVLTLEKYASTIKLTPSEKTYKSIAAHPDIFFFQKGNELIYAPNTPDDVIKSLKNNGIKLTEGKKEVGAKYPETVPYNAVDFHNTLIHNIKFTDEKILSQYNDTINVNQGYTRCNLLVINNKAVITSDRGIEKALSGKNIDILYIDPKQVILEGQNHGFFPGCCGLVGNILFVCGSTKKMKERQKLYKFLKNNKIHLIELYEGPLTDVGSIILVENGSTIVAEKEHIELRKNS